MPQGLKKYAGKNGPVEGKSRRINRRAAERRQKPVQHGAGGISAGGAPVRRPASPGKHMLLEAWEGSDSKETFARALQEHGFYLARGDRRGYVALDINGGIFSLSRWLDISTKCIKGEARPA